MLAKWHPLDSFELNRLIEKPVTLLAIGTMHRMQILLLIKIDNIMKSSMGIEIRVLKLIKTSKPEDISLCYCSHILRRNRSFLELYALRNRNTRKIYMEITASLRRNCKNLFIRIKKPYTITLSATISKWIKSILVRSDINKKYTVYSTRHASTCTSTLH